MQEMMITYNTKDNYAYIKNSTYNSGVSCFNADINIDIGVEYLYLQYRSFYPSETYYVDNINHVQEFTPEQLMYLEKLVTEWVQPLGQEGNPTLEQAIISKQFELTNNFNKEVDKLTNNTAFSEIASWNKQETEARAWYADNDANTPFIDNLLSARNAGKDMDKLETKAALVTKILLKADAYNDMYASMLGDYQSKLSLLDTCTSIEEVMNIN